MGLAARAACGLRGTLRRGSLCSMVAKMGDELVSSVRAYLAEHDPDVLAAVADVDRSLIRSELRLSPLARLVASAQQARFFERLAASRSTPKGSAQ